MNMMMRIECPARPRDTETANSHDGTSPEMYR